jgi:hypothetical protein
MTTLHSRNGNCVAALQPSPGDLFVVTTIGAKVVFVKPVGEYEQALRLAETFSAQMPVGKPFTVKVMGMSLDELLAFRGISRADFAAGLTIPDVELRELAESTCKDVLRRSNDAAVRADAMDLLADLGVLQ